MTKKQLLADLDALKEMNTSLTNERVALEEKQTELANRVATLENKIRDNQNAVTLSTTETDAFQSQLAQLKNATTQLTRHQDQKNAGGGGASGDVNEELKELLEMEKQRVAELQESLNAIKQNVLTAQAHQRDTQQEMEKTKEELKKLKQYLLQEVKARVVLEEQLKEIQAQGSGSAN